MWAWGNNSGGRLGLGDTAVRLTPYAVLTTPVSGDSWTAVFAGAQHTIALRDDGTLWTWGINAQGQLGINNTSNQSTPLQVLLAGVSGDDWITVSAGGEHTIALRDDGTFWSWGNNGSGQLGKGIAGDGQGTNTNNWTPWRIAASLLPTSASDWTVADTATTPNNGAVDVAMRTRSITLRFDRPMRTDASFLDDATIAIDNGAAVNVSAGVWSEDNTVFTAPLTLVAEETLHEVTAHGFVDEFSSLSGTSEMNSHTWTFTTGEIPVDVVRIATGDLHTLVIQADGTLWAWGSGFQGRLGLGDATPRSVPTEVPVPGGGLHYWTEVVAGSAHSLALRDDGTLWAWGNGQVGRLGIGGTANQLTPAQVDVPGGIPYYWTAISAGDSHSLALRSDGTLWAWGSGGAGRLGTGDTANQLTPVQVNVPGGTSYYWAAVSAGDAHSFALRSDGTLWAWGNGGAGRLGIGGAANQLTPVQVNVPGGTSYYWTSVSTGNSHTLALRSDGTLWAWGANAQGRLGIGNTVGQQTPVQVASDNDWVAVFAGAQHSLALRDDGTLWAWGNNASGQLGQGDVGTYLVPTLVPITDISGDEWKTVSVSTGSDHVIALRDDGTFWSWGNNGSGQLGKGIAGDGQGVNTNNWIPWRIAASLLPTSASDWAVADTATTPNNAAVDVAVTTDSITVRFDRPMRPGLVGTITIDNAAVLDVSAGIWSEGNMVLTIPLSNLEIDTLYTVEISGFVDDFSSRSKTNEMYPHIWTFLTTTLFEGEALSYDGSTCATCHFVESLRLEHQFVVSRGVSSSANIEYGCQKCHGQDFVLQDDKVNWEAHSPIKIDNRTYTAVEDGSGMRAVDTYGCLSCHGGADDPIHGGYGSMLNAHTGALSFDPSVDTGCSSCHGPMTSATDTGFSFGVMDLASAHADYWLAVRDGRVLDENAVSEAMQGDANPFGCGVCHARIDNDSRLRPQIVAHLDAVTGPVTCTTCHVAPDANDPNWAVEHLTQRTLVPELTTALGLGGAITPARAGLTALDFFDALSARTRAELNLATTDENRLEAETLAPLTITRSEHTTDY